MTIQEQKDEAWKAYRAISGPAWKAYEAISDPALKAYEAIRDSAYEAYRAKMKEIEATEDIIEIKGVKYKKI